MNYQYISNTDENYTKNIISAFTKKWVNIRKHTIFTSTQQMPKKANPTVTTFGLISGNFKIIYSTLCWEWLFPRTVISSRQGINWYMPLLIHESLLLIICCWNYSKVTVKEVHKEYCVEMFINKLFSIGPRLWSLITIQHCKESGVIGEMVAFRSGARLHKWIWTTQTARKAC